MRGRKPLPSKLKLVQGNRGKRAANKSEPKVKREIPPCPSHIIGEARKEWRRMSCQLHALGLMATIDKAQLAIYCQAWKTWVEAQENVEKFGMIVISPNSGYQQQSPYLSIANQAMRMLQSALVEFGMSPSSRSRIHVDLEDKKDELEDILNAKPKKR